MMLSPFPSPDTSVGTVDYYCSQVSTPSTKRGKKNETKEDNYSKKSSH